MASAQPHVSQPLASPAAQYRRSSVSPGCPRGGPGHPQLHTEAPVLHRTELHHAPGPLHLGQGTCPQQVLRPGVTVPCSALAAMWVSGGIRVRVCLVGVPETGQTVQDSRPLGTARSPATCFPADLFGLAKLPLPRAAGEPKSRSRNCRNQRPKSTPRHVLQRREVTAPP